MEKKDALNPNAEQPEISAGKEHLAGERAVLTAKNDDVETSGISYEDSKPEKQSTAEEPEATTNQEAPETGVVAEAEAQAQAQATKETLTATEEPEAEEPAPETPAVKETEAATDQEAPETEVVAAVTEDAPTATEEPEAEEPAPETPAAKEPEATTNQEAPETGVVAEATKETLTATEEPAPEAPAAKDPEATTNQEEPETEVVAEVTEDAPTATEEPAPETPAAKETEATTNQEAPETEVVAAVTEDAQTATEEPAPEEPVAKEPEATTDQEAPETEVVAEVTKETPTAAEEPAPEALAPEAPVEAPLDASDQEKTETEEVITATKVTYQQEEDDDDAEVLTEKYGAMSRDSLVVTLEALVESDDIAHIRKHIGFIKVAYRKLLRDENLAAYEQRLSKDKDDQVDEEKADLLTERFDNAFNIYKEKKTAWDKALEKEMQDNLAHKEAILEELRQLIDSEEELKKTYDQFNDLQERWRSVGPVPRGSKSTLWNNYHFLVEKFFDKVNINKELKDLDLKKNLEAKTELCEKAEELFLETSITRSFQQLQKLHEAWKETGPVPKDKKDDIWERFRFATEKLNKRRQDHYDKLREEQNKNYAAKLVLCEKAEELLNVIPDTPRKWQDKTNKINELFKLWKTIGFAPKKVNNEVWNRFRNALDAFFANKKEFFRKYKDQQRENYNQKLNLCLQAEALRDSEDWRSTTESLISLQNEWKKIGPVPVKFSDKIWKRFRQACDHFFNRKSEHFTNIGEQQTNNLNEKLALIDQIKNHNYTDDNKENLDTLKDFQRKWMEIGHVPIKQKEKIQGEFRKAIDNQFDVLNISKKAKNTLSFRTKIENLKNTQNADSIIQKERNFITGKIKNLEADIKVLENNIGFFASSKKADLLKAEFEEKIERARHEIGVLKEKMKILRDA